MLTAIKQFNYNLGDKVAIVTGAARGIGESIAYGLAASKASLIIIDIKESLFIVEKKMKEYGFICDAMIVDVADRAQVRNMVKSCINVYGKIDILINNASISNPSLFSDMSEDVWENMIQTNLTSVFYCCKEVLPYMVKERKGKIVNFSSVNAQFGAKETAHYCAAKGGVESLSKSLAREIGPYNIQVNVISPGFIDTAMLELMPQSQKDKLIRRIPLGRLGLPADFIGASLFLVSEASDYITGQVINVNGGFFMS
jgi:3-oxoacyl-[acyl-carrier protein] reductase